MLNGLYFEFVVRNLNTGVDSPWIDLLNTTPEDLTEEWFAVRNLNIGISNIGDNDYEVVDVSSPFDFSARTIQYAGLEELLMLKETLESIDDEGTLLRIANQIQNGQDISELNLDAWEIVILSDRGEREDDLAYGWLEILGGLEELSDADLEYYFDTEALGRDFRLSGDDWTWAEEALYDYRDDLDTFQVIDDISISGEIPEEVLEIIDDSTARQLEMYLLHDDEDLGEMLIEEFGIEGIQNKEAYFDYGAFGRDLALDANYIDVRLENGEIVSGWVYQG